MNGKRLTKFEVVMTYNCMNERVETFVRYSIRTKGEADKGFSGILNRVQIMPEKTISEMFTEIINKIGAKEKLT